MSRCNVSLPKGVTRKHNGRELFKEQLRIGNPLDVIIPDRKHFSNTRSSESVIGHMSIHKGNTWLEPERSRHLCMAECLS